MRTILGIIFLCLLYSCTSPKSANLGAASSFFPPKYILQEGIVNKYHVTRYEDKQEPATDINYSEYRLHGDTLIINNYDAGLRFKNKRKYLFKDTEMHLVAREATDGRNNPTKSKVGNNSFISWDNSNENSNTFYEETAKFFTRQVASSQDYIVDTSVLNLPAKKIKSHYKIQVQYSTDSVHYSGEDASFYALGKGEVYYRSTYQGTTLIGELVEQMPSKKFNNLEEHGVKRIAYIDPQNITPIHPDFSPCTTNENNIFDYYNGDPDGHLEGNRGRVRYFVDSLVSPEILEGQSGIISVRFIINCTGEIGYFTTEESDLNYKPKEFPEEVSAHLMEITSVMHPWIPCVIRGEAVDSYAYIIYIIKNGEITQIIP